jgi:uncharacterized coiled-coil protein SlyX
MSSKYLLSISLLSVILQGCGDSADEKNLKRRNNELTRQNQELSQAKAQTAAERDAALKNKEASAAELAKAQKELEATKQSLKKSQDEKAAAEKAKAKLELDLSRQETNVRTLNKQIAEKNNLIVEKEAQITALNTRLGGGNSELERARTELAQLKQERDTLKTTVAKAQADADAARQEVKVLQIKIAELASEEANIIEKSLEDVRGLWLTEYKLEGISEGACYEFAHVGPTGNIAQAIACSDGRVQLQKHLFDRFSAQSVPMQTNNDYIGSYGFVVEGTDAGSSCADPSASLLTPSERLIFEMTLQDNGGIGRFPASRSMVVAQGDSFKGFVNASAYFVDNRLNYPQMLALASAPNAEDLTKAAAAFIGVVQDQAANVSLGCFNASGVFSASSSN